MSDSLLPHGLWPTRLLRPWDLPGKTIGVGCHCLLQGIFPPGSPALQADTLPSGPPGKPVRSTKILNRHKENKYRFWEKKPPIDLVDEGLS